MYERDCNDCEIYYLFAGAVGIAVMVVGLVPLLLLRRKKTGSKGDSDKNHEMTPKEEGSIIYRAIVISNGKRKAKEKNAEDVMYSETKKTNCQDEEITYADVKFNVKGKKSDNAHKSMDSHTTYADIKPKSCQPPPQGGSTDIYACVNKKKTVNT